MVWLKLIHVTAISIWSAGLVCLPGLYVRRSRVMDEASLHRLHALVRFLYVNALSPAAFIGIATGTALIFLRETWAPWFTVKLFLVGGLATIHVLTGLVIIRLFDEGRSYPAWRAVTTTATTLATALAIVVVVLAKPEIPSLVPDWMREPGALQRLVGFNPFPRS